MVKTTTSKLEVENCIKLSIFVLNQNGLLTDSNKGAMSWSTVFAKIFETGYLVKLTVNDSYIRLFYKDLSPDGKTIDVDYKVKITTSHCHYGNVRYWFVCPLWKDNKPCDKRVGVLYKPPYSNYFGCRHCFNLTYESSKLSGTEKTFGNYLPLFKLQEIEQNIKRRFYRGRLTKRFNSLLKKAEKTKRAVSFEIDRFKASTNNQNKSSKRPNGLAYKSHEH